MLGLGPPFQLPSRSRESWEDETYSTDADSFVHIEDLDLIRSTINNKSYILCNAYMIDASYANKITCHVLEFKTVIVQIKTMKSLIMAVAVYLFRVSFSCGFYILLCLFYRQRFHYGRFSSLFQWRMKCFIPHEVKSSRKPLENSYTKTQYMNIKLDLFIMSYTASVNSKRINK